LIKKADDTSSLILDGKKGLCIDFNGKHFMLKLGMEKTELLNGALFDKTHFFLV
jgi:hypothetical protein